MIVCKAKKARFESFLEVYLHSLEGPSALVRACSYALTTGGKRVRPIVTMLIGGEAPAVLQGALSVELFHTASLVADDLPCMDDDGMRRDKETVHVKFGETTALLSSYGLICAAFQQVSAASRVYTGDDAKERLQIALEAASELAGINGATGGQYLDLNPESAELDHIKDIFYKKTVTLFEVAFIFGWLFSGRSIKHMDLVRRAAYDFGMAFQIADDIVDVEDGDSMNIVTHLGMDAARNHFEERMGAFEAAVSALELPEDGFFELRDAIRDRVLNLGRLA